MLSRNLFLVVPKILAEVLQKWRNKNKFLSSYSSTCVSPIKCAVPSGNSKKSHDNKNCIELACLVRTGKILVSFFFCKFMDLTCGSVHKLAKKELDKYFPSTDLTLVH